ncbi:hypothetical protein D3C81_1906820 [compost metagenome]
MCPCGNVNRIWRQILKHRHPPANTSVNDAIHLDIRLARQQHQADLVSFSIAAQYIPSLQLIRFKTYIFPPGALLADSRNKPILAGRTGLNNQIGHSLRPPLSSDVHPLTKPGWPLNSPLRHERAA